MGFRLAQLSGPGPTTDVRDAHAAVRPMMIADKNIGQHDEQH